ncbi:MAG: AbrB/MazE/SpoVT family DNA-binding domain-containing protein [Nitrososphaeria archaeon]
MAGKGQVTIPAKLRREYNIVEVSRLTVRDAGEGILIKPATTVDLDGTGSRCFLLRK